LPDTWHVAGRQQSLSAQLAAGDPQKCRTLIERDLQAIRQELRHLPGRPPLIAFDLAQAGHGTADTLGKLFSGQVQRFALPGDPGAE